MSVLYPFRAPLQAVRAGFRGVDAPPPHQAGFLPADALIRAAAAHARTARSMAETTTPARATSRRLDPPPAPPPACPAHARLQAPAEPVRPVAAPDVQAIEAALREHVLAGDYPCVAARSAFNRGRVQVAVHGRLGDADSARRACADLQRYVAGLASDEDPDAPMTWVSAYAAEPGQDEAGFERALWRHLQLMHERDAPDHGWSPAHSADPADAKFAFCIGGEAFFVIGLHPAASRLARRAPYPMLVFNLHRQFDALRAAGRYERMKTVIRQRDTALQGSPNPMLDDFGTRSEARQYAGRAVADGWACPFHAAPRSTYATQA
jgi:FPC/CPF motif-containing protein YcgG